MRSRKAVALARATGWTFMAAISAGGCTTDNDNWAEARDLVPPASSPAAEGSCVPGACERSAIQHVVIIVQENHSFDNYFGRYCSAATGSNPTCTDGPGCCEAGPETDPMGFPPEVLTDELNTAHDPPHFRGCMLTQMNGGKMDSYVAGGDCGDRRNFAYARPDTMLFYHQLAREGALADRYFQSVAGGSAANSIYFAQAGHVFDDNEHIPLAIGAGCLDENKAPMLSLEDQSLGDLLSAAGVGWKFYAEGYGAMFHAEAAGACPEAPEDCAAEVDAYPCTYDAADNPFSFYARHRNDWRHLVDLEELYRDVGTGRLPSVSFVKALGYRTEHPGSDITSGAELVKEIVDLVQLSPFGPRTLILVTWDESGGYFDHVPPPPASAFDEQPYGPRVPLLAIGPFAKKNHVSHVEMEHSSIVAFIEWNWLGAPGLLGRRDALVNGIGSLLEPGAMGAVAP